MLAEVIRIGNSKGIRLPSYIIKECNISDKVEMEVKDGKIVIIPIKEARKNWGTEFRQMHENNDDMMLIDETVDIDIGDWAWK